MAKILKYFNTKLDCVKCGFSPASYPSASSENKWKIEHKEECKWNCNWDDEVKEHLHLVCPTCGFEMISPCKDHEASQKAQAESQWSTGKEDAKGGNLTPATKITHETKVVERNSSPRNSVVSYDTTPNRVGGQRKLDVSWNTECPDCPLSKKSVDIPTVAEEKDIEECVVDINNANFYNYC